MSADPLADMQGCGDSLCCIRRPSGMVTNGGCRCPQYHLRRAIGRLTAALDEANARAERMRVALHHIACANPGAKSEQSLAYDMALVARQALATLPDTAKRAAALSDLAALDGESL